MTNYVVAHDLGTTGNKATLYDREGKLVGASYFSYDTEYAHTGWAEQNPEDWWRAVCQSTRQLLGETGVKKNDIACITFSGQMMGAVPVDQHARPLRNAIIWADQRALTKNAGSASACPLTTCIKSQGIGSARLIHWRKFFGSVIISRKSSRQRTNSCMPKIPW